MSRFANYFCSLPSLIAVSDAQQLQRLHLAGRLHGLLRPEQRDEVRKRIARMG